MKPEMVTVVLFSAVVTMACGGRSEHDDARWIEPTSSETTRTSTSGGEPDSNESESEPRTVEQARVEPESPAAEEERSCDADDQCVVSAFAGCCACAMPHYAINRSSLQEREQLCVVDDCEVPECPQHVSTFGDAAEARCLEGLCRLVDGGR